MIKKTVETKESQDLKKQKAEVDTVISSKRYFQHAKTATAAYLVYHYICTAAHCSLESYHIKIHYVKDFYYSNN